MVKLRPLRWYERIKTGPSPEDSELLQITRELAVKLDSWFWYRQIVWGRFDHGGMGWLISMPVMSRELLLGPVGIPPAELMLPEFLRGKLSPEEWRILIQMHLSRFKANNSGRMSRLLGLNFLVILGGFAVLFLLFYGLFGRLGFDLVFPAWVPVILASFLWMRRPMKRWEFELDRISANQFGTEQVVRVLEKMETLDPKARSTASLDRFSRFWSPSIQERLGELNNPRVGSLSRSYRMPSVGIRGRAIIILLGVGIFVGSGVVAGNLYGQAQQTVACTTNTCAALVVIAAVGYWSAVLGGISFLPVVARRVRQARRKKKYTA